MGWDIYIGEAVQVDNDEEEIHELQVLRWTERAAPTFPNDELTANSNHRAPSYTVWDTVMREVGLGELFFNSSTGLMRTDSICTPITAAHLHEVQAALLRWRERYPQALPRFGGWHSAGGASDEDAALARLVWLEWWMRWALEQCSNPALYCY